jgi:hypothetical protein
MRIHRTVLCLILAGVSANVTAADILVSGTWSKTIGKTELKGAARARGGSLIPSPAGVARLSITNTQGGPWLVRVSRNDLNWPPGLRIAVRRTSKTVGVLGGETYLDLTEGPRAFVAGLGDQCCIDLQLSVSGASVQTTTGSYRVAITYTVESTSLAFQLLEHGGPMNEVGM